MRCEVISRCSIVSRLPPPSQARRDSVSWSNEKIGLVDEDRQVLGRDFRLVFEPGQRRRCSAGAMVG